MKVFDFCFLIFYLLHYKGKLCILWIVSEFRNRSKSNFLRLWTVSGFRNRLKSGLSYYPCYKQGYCNRVLNFFPVNNFVHKICTSRGSSLLEYYPPLKNTSVVISSNPFQVEIIFSRNFTIFFRIRGFRPSFFGSFSVFSTPFLYLVGFLLISILKHDFCSNSM